MHAPSSSRYGSQWDPAYEKKAVGLLSLGFGLVGLDRFIINPLFPVMAKDLGLNYQDMGLISAVLALTWGLSSIFTGRLSDQIGRKKVLVPAVVIFSLLVATSGLATGLASLLVIRGLMGLAEGAFVPASIVSTIEASKPSRIGLNIGLQQTAAPLVGLGLGPVIAVAMLKVLPSWHWVFAIVAVPGLIVAWLMARTLKESAPDPEVSTEFKSSWWEVLRYRNVVFGTLGMCCFLSCLIVLSAFMPNYLTDQLKLSLDQMGMVLAGIGLGSFIGMVAVPALSDKLGRKRTMIVALLLELGALLLLPSIGAEPLKLFAVLFVATFMNAGVVAITVGPLTHHSVPARLATTATGIVVGLGEVVGGALAPAVAGGMAQAMGIAVILQIALAAIAAGTVVVIVGIREPRPDAMTA
ncbi:MFS transporter [Sphaerotilus microaerophilus]|uniref:MFS transporter n=1 Tax=Sphaerotilus microaerophilus TaxID=2914710 RepID=A0ABN6PSI2_9BURK|nr:MFS transporter [Sphaerotilus sp. FB-5]BDI06041.1 MFS transporter [Sphaerotilus sp. FB-5]